MFKIDFVILFENDLIGTSSYKVVLARLTSERWCLSTEKWARYNLCYKWNQVTAPEVFKPASSSGQGNGQGKNTGCWVLQRQIVLVVCCSIDTSATVLGGWVSQSFTAGNTNQCMWVNWVCFWARGGQGTRFGRAESMSCFEPFLHCEHTKHTVSVFENTRCGCIEL